MEINSKKLVRTSRIINTVISIILCFFLILLSNLIIDDVDDFIDEPKSERFQNNKEMQKLTAEMNKETILEENLTSKKEYLEKTIKAAKQNYINEKQSFDNWIQTRKTLGSPYKDEEVIERAKKLDQFYAIEQEWREQLSKIESKIDTIGQSKEVVQKTIDKEDHKADLLYNNARNVYELKVFLIRLLLVLPILALGIYFFIKRRKNKFWPLYFGFTLFSLYVFFFGLLPYLPSYGGYVHYSVGVILSLGIGYYAIKNIREYFDKKQEELKISITERATNVQTDIAEKALDNHYCPSCGKDFIIKKWEFPLSKNPVADIYTNVTNFCRHCGLVLFKDCTNCNHKNFAHLMYCSNCGDKVGDQKVSKP